MFLAALTLSLSSAPAAPLLQEPAFPPGAPFPTLRVAREDLDGSELEAGMWWHAIRPSGPLTGSPGWDWAASRRERADFLAALNGWPDEEREAWLAATAPQPVRLAYRIQQGDRVLTAGEELVIPGGQTRVGYAASRPVLHDFLVEIAQTAHAADPEVRPGWTGAQCGLVLQPMSASQWWLEFAGVVAAAGEDDEIELGSLALLGKRRDARTLAEVSGSLLLAPGAWRRVRLGSDIEFAFQVMDAPPALIAAAGQALAVDAPALALHPALAGLLDRYRDAVTWADPNGLLVFDSSAGQRAAQALLDELAAIPAMQLSLRRGEDSLLEAVVPAGTRLWFAQGSARDALVDWDVEVASSARAADPEFQRLFTGWRGSVRAQLDDAGQGWTSLDARLTGHRLGGRRVLRLAPPDLGTDQAPGKPAVDVALDLPESWSTSFTWSGPRAELSWLRQLPEAWEGAGTVQLRLRASQLAD